MTQPFDYYGDLTITAENAYLAKSLRSVSGRLWIDTPNLSFPMLTRVDGDLDIWSAWATLPALTRVGGALLIGYDAKNAALPVLECVGRHLWIEASGAALPVLEQVRGRIFNRQRTDLPALRTAA